MHACILLHAVALSMYDSRHACVHHSMPHDVSVNDPPIILFDKFTGLRSLGSYTKSPFNITKIRHFYAALDITLGVIVMHFCAMCVLRNCASSILVPVRDPFDKG